MLIIIFIVLNVSREYLEYSMFSSGFVLILFLFLSIPNVVLGNFWTQLYQNQFGTGKSTEDNGEVKCLMGELDEQDMVLDRAFPPPVVHQNYQKYYLDKFDNVQSVQMDTFGRSNSFGRNLRSFLSVKSMVKGANSSSELPNSNEGLMMLNRAFFKKFKKLKRNFELLKVNDPTLARMFLALLKQSRALKGKGSTSEVSKEESLRKLMVQTVFFLADRWDIPQETISTPKKGKEIKNAKKLVKELAKIWPKIKEDGGGEENSGESRESEEKQRKENSEESEENEEKKERRRKVLQLILETANQSNGNGGLSIKLSKANTDGRRRRRKRSDFVVLTIIIGIAILIGFVIYLLCSADSSSESKKPFSDYEGEPDHREVEVKLKASYGDEEDPGRVTHTYIVIGGREYNFSYYGARGRYENDGLKRSQVATFSFRPKLYGTVARAESLLREMRMGKKTRKSCSWGKKTHNSVTHNCVDFSYQFACRVNQNAPQCPPKKQWPKGFKELDKYEWEQNKEDGRLSVFDKNYRSSAQNCELPEESDPLSEV